MHASITRRRGRPSKSQQQQILNESADAIVRYFHRYPIRQPIDRGFAPYYLRLLDGDLGAIREYCDRHAGGHASWEELHPSFFEVIGRLIVLRCYSSADCLLRDIERRGVLQWPESHEVGEYWYRKLQPVCMSARRFINAQREETAFIKREKLWQQYVFQDADSDKKPHQARNELLEWSKSNPESSLFDQANRFGILGLVPKRIFFELAETNQWSRSRWKPSQVARKYACEIAGISESTFSHKYGRK